MEEHSLSRLKFHVARFEAARGAFNLDGVWRAIGCLPHLRIADGDLSFPLPRALVLEYVPGRRITAEKMSPSFSSRLSN